ncbi:MAG TPA: hypothetical protein DCY13_21570, partial [Verrucomicrobiales bacterium]|nr:hypothetical protein [Verrucomicrobiales bacterium]
MTRPDLSSALSILALTGALSLRPSALAQFHITELQADNETGIVDEDGYAQDWIELRNHSDSRQNLKGWTLTDDPGHAAGWVFPDHELDAGEFLVVFASGNDRGMPGRPLHTSFKLKAGGDYLALLRPDGTVAERFAPRFPSQREDGSYGRPADGDGFAFLAFPTPGRANAETLTGRLTTLKFSIPHGLFDEAFTLHVTSAEPDVTLRFTTNGSEPDERSAIMRNPLTIERTTALRVRGYRQGHTPTPVVTASYIFPRDQVDLAADGLPPGGYPFKWGAGNANYGLDENITRDPELREKFVQALQALPSYSIVADIDDLFSDERGIYAHAGWHGRRAERRISLELLPMAGREEGFQIEAGLRMRGGSSRAPRYQKHGFRLFFRGQYGAGKLRYDLFHGEGATEFDHFDLRCTQQYSWHHGYSPNALYVRDQFARDTQLAMGHQSARGNFVHLYINGMYWGMFNPCERPEADFGATYFGGDADDYDVMKVRGGYSEDDGDRRRGLVPTDGEEENWKRLYELTLGDMGNPTNYCRVLGLKPDGTPDPLGRRLVDPVNLIDYMLV